MLVGLAALLLRDGQCSVELRNPPLQRDQLAIDLSEEPSPHVAVDHDPAKRSSALSRLTRSAVGEPCCREVVEHLLLFPGAFGSGVGVVQRHEGGQRTVCRGPGVRLVEHVLPHEQVQISDVLHRFGLAQQRQRALRSAQPDALSQLPQVLLLPRRVEAVRPCGLLEPTRVEPASRPRLQLVEIELAVVDLVHRRWGDTVSLRPGEPLDHHRCRCGCHPVAVGTGDRRPRRFPGPQVPGPRPLRLVVGL